jgi:hypothetical protein
VNGGAYRAVSTRALFWRCDAVVFDLDGTLLQTLHGLHQALNDVLGIHGFAVVSPELVRSSMHTGFAGSVQAALQAVPNATRHHAALLTAYRERYRETMVAQSAGVSRDFFSLGSFSVIKMGCLALGGRDCQAPRWRYQSFYHAAK